MMLKYPAFQVLQLLPNALAVRYCLLFCDCIGGFRIDADKWQQCSLMLSDAL